MLNRKEAEWKIITLLWFNNRKVFAFNLKLCALKLGFGHDVFKIRQKLGRTLDMTRLKHKDYKDISCFVFTLLFVYITFENTSFYAPTGLVCLLLSLWHALVDVYSSPQQVGNHRRATDCWCHVALKAARRTVTISEVLTCIDVADTIKSGYKIKQQVELITVVKNL